MPSQQYFIGQDGHKLWRWRDDDASVLTTCPTCGQLYSEEIFVWRDQPPGSDEWQIEYQDDDGWPVDQYKKSRYGIARLHGQMFEE